MNKKLIKLGKRAGFEKWRKESWKPEGEVFDWASNYDKELEAFAKLIIAECTFVVNNAVLQRIPASTYSQLIIEHFEDKKDE